MKKMFYYGISVLILTVILNIFLFYINQSKDICSEYYGNKSYGIINQNGKTRCYCQTGYTLNSLKDECISPTDYCQEKLGSDDFYSNGIVNSNFKNELMETIVGGYSCSCKSGLVLDNFNRTKCITPTQLCQQVDGEHAFSDGIIDDGIINKLYNCYCGTGYIRNDRSSKCVVNSESGSNKYPDITPIENVWDKNKRLPLGEFCKIYYGNNTRVYGGGQASTWGDVSGSCRCDDNDLSCLRKSSLEWEKSFGDSSVLIDLMKNIK